MGLSNNENMLGIVSDYCKLLINDPRKMLADKIAPVVKVPSIYGYYPTFDAALGIVDMSYVPGTEAKVIPTPKTDNVYDCNGFALSVALTDAELAKVTAGGGTAQAYYEAKIATLVSRAFTSHEKKVWDFVLASAGAADASPDWVDTGNPIKDIETQVNAIRDNCGSGGTIKVFFGNTAWNYFRSNANVGGLVSYTTVPTEEAIMAYLRTAGVDEVHIVRTGTAGSNLVGADVYIALCDDNPSMADASAIKQFRFEPTQAMDYLEVIPDPLRSQEIARLKWFYDIKLTNTLGLRRLTITA